MNQFTSFNRAWQKYLMKGQIPSNCKVKEINKCTEETQVGDHVTWPFYQINQTLSAASHCGSWDTGNQTRLTLRLNWLYAAGCSLLYALLCFVAFCSLMLLFPFCRVSSDRTVETADLPRPYGLCCLVTCSYQPCHINIYP